MDFQKPFIFKVIWVCFINALILRQVLTECSCKVGDLEELEKLNRDLQRIRVEKSNRVEKYLPTELNSNSIVNCDSLVLYEIINDGFKGAILKKCRVCTSKGWSDIELCQLPKCDRENLVGQPKVQLAYSQIAPANQKLFSQGEAIAVYQYSNNKLCKVCESSGEWSKYPQADLCREITTRKPNIDCRVDQLKAIEYKEHEYIRLRIEKPNGYDKIKESDVSEENKVPSKTVVVYQRYLSNLPTPRNDLPSTKNYYPSNPFTKKFCRYCDDGVWSEVESCDRLHCDRDLLNGNPELVYLTNNQRALEDHTLFQPASVIAIYFFGNERFCKQCHENGEWSKYPLSELCKAQTYGGELAIKATTSPKPISVYDKFRYLQDIYNKEAKCTYEQLLSIEKESNGTSFKRVFLISPDRRTKLNPVDEARLPSRTLAVYVLNSSIFEEQAPVCSICVNGEWSSLSSHCTTDTGLLFCEREKLTLSGRILVSEHEEANENQNLFQPGAAMVVYDLSVTTRLCKVCVKTTHSSAEWSRYAETSLCNPNIAFYQIKNLQFGASCHLNDLVKTETEGFLRENVQSFDAKQILTTEIIQDYSMAVYFKANSTTKYCRKCFNGKWSEEYQTCPIEFTLKKCDPTKLRSFNYLVYSENGLRLDENEWKNLVFPGKVVAVNEFGIQKYCKVCNEDGTWSSYPQYQLCDSVRWSK